MDPVSKRGCIGCGAQEEFYGCADIEIKPRSNVQAITPGHQPVQSTSTTRLVQVNLNGSRTLGGGGGGGAMDISSRYG